VFEQFVICNSIRLSLTLPVTQYVGGKLLSVTNRHTHLWKRNIVNEYCLAICLFLEGEGASW